MILNGDHHELGQYVREMADMFGLRDWTFEVNVRPADELDEYRASCAVVHLRSYAVISFRTEWHTWTPEELRQTVCHELIHCHVEKITTIVNYLRERLSSEASELAERTYRAALEYAVDDIATACAEFLPLPIKQDADDQIVGISADEQREYDEIAERNLRAWFAERGIEDPADRSREVGTIDAIP